MKKRFGKLTSAILVLGMTVFMLSAYVTHVKAGTVSGHELQNPVKEHGNTEWDCVWFGSYPQAEIVPSGTYTALSSDLLQEGDIIESDELYDKLIKIKDFQWNANGDIMLDGTYYKRIKKSDATIASGMASSVTQPLGESLALYQWNSDSDYNYFKYEPIKWRVLNVTGNDVFLLADKGLDDPQESFDDIGYWENSGTRSWLNDNGSKNFINIAFTSSERSAIKTTQIAEGVTTVSDKIFLLSTSDVAKESYGFDSNKTNVDTARLSRSTTFAKAKGTVIDTGREYGPFYGCSPWLMSSAVYVPGIRTPSYFVQDCVSKGAVVSAINSWLKMCAGRSAVRPALHLNLTSSSKVCTYAGTVN